MTVSRILPLLLFASVAHAEPPWGKVDLQAAPELHQKACAGCHIRMYGGDGSKMYTRDGRMLTNKQELLQRVSACNAQVSSGWSREEEGAVAAWLNQQYYHFDK